MIPTTIFLHGLDSSGNGTKGQFFSQNFPDMLRPDFDGSLESRLVQLDKLCCNKSSLTFVGSSFGGLMGTCYAIRRSEKVARLILLAPALNYEDYTPPANKLEIPAMIVIGKHDTVTPPDLVIPLAEETFTNLDIRIEDDDHLLHQSFQALDWTTILST